jgi:uncharacterized integral membrane protein
MLTLIATVILGIGAAYFATQNPGYTDISLAGYSYHLPLYLLVLGSLLLGLLVSSLVQLGSFLSSSFILRSKDGQLKNNQKSLDFLRDSVHALELENARLRSKDNEIILDSSRKIKEKPTPNFFQRARRSLSTS